MAETNAGNFLSPEALIMLPLAVTLDAIGIILVCFALDDFFITDIIGWATLGVWSAFRSQIKGGGATIETPDRGGRKDQAQLIKKQVASKAAEEAAKKAAEETAKETAKGTAKGATKATKAAKWTKWIRFLEFVPYLGVLPFWTISTVFILKEE